jgi:hypothetical protein
VKFDLPISELALYNIDMKKVVEAGEFELQVERLQIRSNCKDDCGDSGKRENSVKLSVNGEW